jgi:hypothetical protein
MRSVCVVVTFMLFGWSPSLQHVHAQFKMRNQNVYSDLPLNLKIKHSDQLYQAKEIAVGGNVCVGNELFSSVVEYNFRALNEKAIPGGGSKRLHAHELLLGLRYYPARPTFLLGGAAIRLTGGGSIGGDLDMDFISMYYFGFCLTGVRNASGVMIQAVRRSANTVHGRDVQPYWGLRLGVVIGPNADGPK